MPPMVPLVGLRSSPLSKRQMLPWLQKACMSINERFNSLTPP